jgi:hypothetical protein
MHRIVPSTSSWAGRRALMDVVCFFLEFGGREEMRRPFDRSCIASQRTESIMDSAPTIDHGIP